MLTREQKREQSDELRGVLSDVSTLFLLENTGLNVNDVNVLRSEIRKTEGSYKVVKNSVVKLAVEGTDLEVITPHMTGPNLTDEYWLHGGKLTDIYDTVMEGVPAKGMLAWKKQLPLGDILAVSAYVGSLRGTTPTNAKPPQGEPFEYDLEAILAAEAAETAARLDPTEADGHRTRADLLRARLN